MLTRTKMIMAGIATLALVGTAVVVAADDGAGSGADAPMASYHGRDVTFTYDAQAGSLAQYAVDGATLFDSIKLAEFNASDAKAREGGRVVIATDGDLARAVVFDEKNAAFALGSPAGNTVTLVVPDGAVLAYHAGDKGWSPSGVLIRYANNATGRLELRGEGNVSVDGQTITIVLGAHAHLLFRIEGHPWEAAKERLALLKLEKRLREAKGKAKASARAKAKANGRGAQGSASTDASE